ncbi:MAG: SpoIIE family protein phosphatase [Phycisphaerales bacterium]|nr:MAG: SpoIIE family protein phosphatase [Phycisphaerales bacterium]
MGQLVITLPNGNVSRHLLGEAAQIVGRDAACDIPVDDPSTSRQHARISPVGRSYRIEDLGSKNGTYVNDVPCTLQNLSNGDQILFGSVRAVYSTAEEPTSHTVVITEDVTASHATRYVSREKQLELSKQRLEMIYELSQQLTTLQGQDRLLNDAMTICFETLHFERGAIAVRRPDGRTLDWPVVRNLYGTQGELTVSRTLLSRALERGERAIFTDTDLGNADPTVSMVRQGIRSAMCVPLIHRDQILGVIYGDRIRGSVSYANEDIDFLAGIGQQVSIGLINCRLVEEQKQTVRLRHDISLARTIQTGLLPTELPNRENLKIAAINDPGQRVSGDYYDVIETGDGRVWCLVADVTGEGVAAALLMANLQAVVRVTIPGSESPGELLTRWNKLICSNTDTSKFITCVLALIDPRTHQMRIASAGHFAPLITRPTQEKVEELGVEAGYPLGIDCAAEYPTVAVDLGPGAFTAFYYTDGVIEAFDTAGDSFGKERLLEALVERADLNPQALVKQLRKGVSSFVGGAPQSDDITLLAARIT